MAYYDIGFTYKVEEYGVVSLEASDPTEADEFGREYVRESFPDVTDVEIDYVKELKVIG